jgi:hypothetical protein
MSTPSVSYGEKPEYGKVLRPCHKKTEMDSISMGRKIILCARIFPKIQDFSCQGIPLYRAEKKISQIEPASLFMDDKRLCLTSRLYHPKQSFPFYC